MTGGSAEFPAADELANDLLYECQQRFEATGNGLWVWRGINICFGGHLERAAAVPAHPFPCWITEYLGQAAFDLMGLGNLNNPSKIPASAAFGEDAHAYRTALAKWRSHKIKAADAPAMALAALKFDAPGTQNRFAQFFSDMESLATAIFVKYLGHKKVFEASKHKDRTSIDKKKAAGERIRPRLKNIKTLNS